MAIIINGTSNGDVINASLFGEEVLINGLGENDTITGSNFNDTLRGNQNDDLIFGSIGNDRVNGGDGVDEANYSSLSRNITFQLNRKSILKDNLGIDTLFNIEKITGSRSRSNVIDGTGISSALIVDLESSQVTNENFKYLVENLFNVIGGSGNDRIIGNEFINQLNGGDGNDTLNGKAGNDILLESTGNDRLIGGEGNDTVTYSSSIIAMIRNTAIDIEKVVNGGVDRLSEIETIIGTIGANNQINASSLHNNISVNVNLLTNSLFASTPIPTQISVRNFTNVIGTRNNDTITGDNFNNILNSSKGDDILDGGNGNDILIGGTGSDTLIGSRGNDTLRGGNSLPGDIDIVNYSLSNIRVSLNPELIVTKSGFTGSDTLIGIEKIIASDKQSNLVNFSEATQGLNVDLKKNSDNLVNGTTTLTIVNFVNVNGGNGNDTINGNAQNNTLQGGGGNDTIRGREGDDIILGSTGNDVLTGGEGNDTLSYSFFGDGIILKPLLSRIIKSNNETDRFFNIETIIGTNNRINTIDVSNLSNTERANINLANNSVELINLAHPRPNLNVFNFRNVIGGKGTDLITGNNSANLLQGNSGNDLLEGLDGNDTLIGNSGQDTLIGGNGIDTADYSLSTTPITFVTKNLNGNLIFQVTGDGIDTITEIENIVGSIGQNNLIDTSKIIPAQGFAINVNLGNFSNNFRIASSTPGSISTFTLRNFTDVNGTRNNDTMTGNSNDNIFQGNNGEDSIKGENGNDTLYGGNNNDTLLGGNGDDFLFGSGERDSLVGGNGNDVLMGDFGYRLFNNQDTLVGGGGKDTLTGGNNPDVFEYTTLSDSNLNNFDTITDFNVNEDLIRTIPTFQEFINSNGLQVADLTTSSISEALNTLIGWGANKATTFTVEGDSSNTYLVINNNSSSFSFISDGVIQLANFNGNLSNANFII